MENIPILLLSKAIYERDPVVSQRKESVETMKRNEIRKGKKRKIRKKLETRSKRKRSERKGRRDYTESLKETRIGCKIRGYTECQTIHDCVLRRDPVYGGHCFGHVAFLSLLCSIRARSIYRRCIWRIHPACVTSWTFRGTCYLTRYQIPEHFFHPALFILS